MTIDDTLARLRAGLDRDEAIAQAACDSARADTEGDASRWFVDETEGRASGGVTSGFPQRIVGRPGGANGVVVYDEGYPHVEQARHIALHDPARVLRQVERMRKLLRRHDEAERDSVLSERDAGFEAGVYAALELLASIYTEDTTETGEA